MVGLRTFAKRLDFVGPRRYFLLGSLTLCVISVVLLLTRGLNFGLDFSGGVLVDVRFQRVVAASDLRVELERGGFEKYTVQASDQEQSFIVRLPQSDDANLSDAAISVLRGLDADLIVRQVDFVGAQVGSELVEQGVIGTLAALLLILLYIAFRFQLKFALGAIVALFHDVLITLGFFSAVWLEFDLGVLAALLALIGYSLNDTIVVFDRVRGNFYFSSDAGNSEKVINGSIQDVFERSIHTSSTTLLVLVSLLVFGGPAIFDFALALSVGIIVGTYSSFCIASPVLLLLNIQREDVVIEARSDKETDVV